MDKRGIIRIVSSVILVGLAVFLLVNASRFKTYNYQNEGVKFSVDYPRGWLIERQDIWAATENQEGSPSKGIALYIDKQKTGKIQVEGTIMPYNLPWENYEKSRFETTNHRKADLWTRVSAGSVEMHLMFEEPKEGTYYYVAVNMSESMYEKHQKNIQRVLERIAY
ncbi:MAG: hypothetical protein ACRCTE_03885 [Cellulosilyticaceae bacterium]